MMSQLTLSVATGAEVLADAEGDGLVQAVDVGLAEAVAVAVGEAEPVGDALEVGTGVMLGRTGWRRPGPGRWAAIAAALVVAETLGVAESTGDAEPAGGAESVGMAESVVSGVVVAAEADDETQAAPRAAALVALNLVPECDEISIPATTPSTATSIPVIAPRRARGRSSNVR
jgi:hypothetical protein